MPADRPPTHCPAIVLCTIPSSDSPAVIIIIMEICKAHSLRLKALNKHSITHIMYIEVEMLSVIHKKYIEKLT